MTAGTPDTPRTPAFVQGTTTSSDRVREALLAIERAGGLVNWCDWTAAEKRVRAMILRMYAEQGRAPEVRKLAARLGLAVPQVRESLARLRQRDAIVLDSCTGEIVGAYPFADRETEHQVTLGGVTLNAMCAIDALGTGAMYHEDVVIRSKCRGCEAPVDITTTERGETLALRRPETTIVWSGARYEGGCAANSLCTVIAFFCSDAHLESWRERHGPGEPGFRLSLDEAFEAGRAIFAGSLSEDAPSASSGPALAEGCCEPRAELRRRAPRYDLAVIGAGSAGFSAAIRAAELGARVALMGHGTLGGTCVNVGCVPSKTLIRGSAALYDARAAQRFSGLSAAATLVDWRALVRQKDDLVASLREARYTDLLPQYPSIEYFDGTARLTTTGVKLKGAALEADRVVITTGARPARPTIAGIDDVPYLTSTSALALERLPGSMVILGGGYVGAELAQLFARVGVNVTLACRSLLLPDTEPEISAALTWYFEQEGITVRDHLSYQRLRRTDHGIALDALSPGGPVTLEAEQLLCATGRVPDVEELGLASLGIEVEEHGGIRVDAHMRTSREHTYAAGDVTGKDQFVYMAAYGGKLAAENALRGDGRAYDSSAMPTVVFTDPHVASVGLTESRAREEGRRVDTSTLSLDHVPRALAARDRRGLIKLIADRRDGRLLGAHILAPEGADAVQAAALAIKHRMTVSELAETLFPYLTTVEGLKLAAQAFTRDVTRLSCCAG